MARGMAQHLTGLNAYPNCQVQSISFGHDIEQDDPDWGSSVIFARVQPDLAMEVETLLANEVVPKGQRWDAIPSILLGAYTRQGAGISKYTESKAHLLPTLHKLAASRAVPTQQEYTSIQLNRVSELQKNGRYAPPGLPDSQLRGEYHSTHNRWLHFDPKRQHAVEPVVGWRVSLVYFTPSRLHALD
eukprot:1930010-Amphidinium_carterae.2